MSEQTPRPSDDAPGVTRRTQRKNAGARSSEVAPLRTVEPRLSKEVAARRRSLRTGWTTGTCAAAAAKAATIALVSGELPAEVEVGLPNGQRVAFPVESDPDGRAVVIKDAGDDPDCTHGARITAAASWPSSDGPAPVGAANPPASAVLGRVRLLAGPGVGIVTKPGLGIPIGEPSVTAVPRRMIEAAVGEVTTDPVEITVSVPGGEEMAAETTNARLGILGGISLLGTTGIVRPFSTAAYRASVVQQIDVAAAQGVRTMVLCTGHRSERLARRLYPDLDEVAFVEVGDFTGIALRRAAANGMDAVAVVAMGGKVTKLAAGVMMTHFHRSAVDTELLAEVARTTGAVGAVIDAARATATARHFVETCAALGETAPLEELCRRARAACLAHVGHRLAVTVVLADFEGAGVLAAALAEE